VSVIASKTTGEEGSGRGFAPPQNKNYYSNYNNISSASRIRGHVTAVSCFNARPQSLGPTEKLFFQLILFFGCCLTCVLLSPSGVCYVTASTNHRWLLAWELWWLECRLPALETPCLGCRLLACDTVSCAGYWHPRHGVSSAGSHVTFT